MEDYRAKPRERGNESPITRARMAAGMTQKELADKLGCFSKDVSQWESGKRELKLSTGVKIAGILGISAEEIAAFYENYGKNEN